MVFYMFFKLPVTILRRLLKKSLVRKEWAKSIGRIRYPMNSIQWNWIGALLQDDHVWSLMGGGNMLRIASTKTLMNKWKKTQYQSFSALDGGWRQSSAPHDLNWIISRWVLVQDQVPCCKNLEIICLLAVLWKGMGVHSCCGSLRANHLVPGTLASNPGPTTGSCARWVLNKILPSLSETLHLYTGGKVILFLESHHQGEINCEVHMLLLLGCVFPTLVWA